MNPLFSIWLHLKKASTVVPSRQLDEDLIIFYTNYCNTSPCSTRIHSDMFPKGISLLCCYPSNHFPHTFLTQQRKPHSSIILLLIKRPDTYSGEPSLIPSFEFSVRLPRWGFILQLSDIIYKKEAIPLPCNPDTPSSFFLCIHVSSIQSDLTMSWFRKHNPLQKSHYFSAGLAPKTGIL